MQISVECPASRLHVCADFAIVSDKPEAVARSALMAEVPRQATPRRPTVVRRELKRSAAQCGSSGSGSGEEEEAKVHFCDDVAAIKWRRASELAAVCGGGAVGVKSLYRSRAVERDTMELWTPRDEITFTARPKIHSNSQICRYGRSIFCLPHQPNFSVIFDLCLHWVSVASSSPGTI